MSRALLLALTACVVFVVCRATTARAGVQEKIIVCTRTDRAPVLDGLLHEQEWTTAQPVLDFLQFDPEEGSLPTEQTSVRILYDNHALYVGVICYDAIPEQIVRQLIRRDRTSEADRFSVLIDSYHDHQTAFVFSTNVSGVQGDGVLSRDGTVYDVTWDAVWDVATSTHRDGWSAEFEIPFDALRFSSAEGGEMEWGANFRRYISRKSETVEWVMVPRSEQLQISHWGHLVGLKDVTPPLHLTLSPYLSGTSLFQSATPRQPSHATHDLLGGMDIKYGLTRDFTLDAALNPDFGQVEVDQAVLNLTVFETHYPEKRPFFLEGSQLFAFGTAIDNTALPLFFSRRIGKQPGGAAGLAPPDGWRIVENPSVTSILGAVKFSGHSAAGLSAGVLTAYTGEEHALLRSAAGRDSAVRTEPRGSYSVVRLKQEFARDSWIGALLGSAATESRTPALMGGCDWNIRLGDAAYTLDGYVAGARPSLSTGHRAGYAGRLLLSKISATHWYFTTAHEFFTRGFNPNDLGFFAQPRDHGGYVQLLYRENFADDPFRRYGIAFNPEYRWNWDGVMTHAAVNLEASAELTNFWSLGLTATHSLPACDDAERGIIGTYRRPAGNSAALWLQTDPRRDVSALLRGTVGGDDKGKKSVAALLSLTLRPAQWVELIPALLYSASRGEEAWLFPNGNVIDPAVAAGPFSVFGERDLDQLDAELRGIVTFTRDLSLQFFSQVLVARGRYEQYRRLVTRSRLVPYSPAQGILPSADFNETSLNANVVVRWEYVPGSTVYLAWTQRRFDDSGRYEDGFGGRLADVFRLPRTDVLLLKVSYRLPL